MTRTIALIFLSALIFSCGDKTPRFERLDGATTGIQFINEVVETDSFNIMQNEYMYNGGGVGVADLNQDGLQDLVFIGNKVSSRIYLNLGDFKFQDITEKFEGLTNDQWISGVAAVDINADGWMDLYFTATMSKDSLKRKNQLWVNQGLGGDGLPYFKEMAGQYGIADMGHSMHAAFFDYDLDGDLDLYVLNNIVNNQVPTNYRPKIMDGSSINNDKFYKNMGDGTFVDATLEAGIVYEGYGLGIAIGDINKDGYPDIYVSNDYVANDLLYINQGDGTFRNEAKTYLSYQSRFSMGNDMSDINHDGYLDIMTTDMLPEQYFRKKQTINGNSYMVYVHNEKYGYEPQYVRNMLHLHNGFQNGEMLPFSEVGQMAGIYQTEWSWSPLFADFDNDGDRDLFVTNGFPKDLTDKDFTNYKAQVYGSLATDRDILPRIPVVKVSNYAFENAGGFKFVNQTAAWGMDIPSFSNGAAFVDLDNDGDLDYITNNINDEAFVYRNNTIGKLKDKPGHYVRIGLKGSGSNTSAIGAKAELWCNGTLQYYEHYLTRGYISSVDPVIHFGLGDAEIVDSIRIIWPTGQRTTFLKNIEPNQLLILKEEDASAYIPGNMASISGKPLFEHYDNGIEYAHLQDDYIDFFQSQRIIHYKFSQIGPCMAKGDLDGDGQDDLLIGGSPQAPTTVFLNKGGRFEKTAVAGLTEIKKCTEADLLILDVNGDGLQDVVAVAGGYANENENDYRHYLYLNNGAGFTQTELPVPPFPASVVRAFDYDQDGDLDLFIGARVKRGGFPLAHHSFILTNDGGRFTPLEASGFDLGMVTDAVWSDHDGDGWPDLIVTRDWNTVAILKNNKGKTFSPAPHKDLDGMHGFWTCIVAGDFDQDGNEDYIVGNLGENHRFHASEDMPMRLYAVDLDNNGVIDPLTTAYWKDKNGVMQEYPVNYLDELAAQSPYFRKKFTSYTNFSFSTIDSTMDRSAVPPEKVFQVNSTSSYILWNEGGRFKWERLPDVVQTAPVKKILVQDFNGDNIPDLLLAGNSHAYDVSTGIYDANRGTVMMGLGNRAFEVLPASKSGLAIRGQVGSLAYFAGSVPWLAVGVNRDKIHVFKTGKGGVQ